MKREAQAVPVGVSDGSMSRHLVLLTKKTGYKPRPMPPARLRLGGRLLREYKRRSTH
jgi:hypothetical protein